MFARIVTYTADPSPYRIEEGLHRTWERLLPLPLVGRFDAPSPPAVARAHDVPPSLRVVGGEAYHARGFAATSWPLREPRRCVFTRIPHTGSLLSMVESRVLMVAEVLRHDQTLTRKSGSWPT